MLQAVNHKGEAAQWNNAHTLECDSSIETKVLPCVNEVEDVVKVVSETVCSWTSVDNKKMKFTESGKHGSTMWQNMQKRKVANERRSRKVEKGIEDATGEQDG